MSMMKKVWSGLTICALFAASATAQQAKTAAADVGQAAPAFELPGVDGKVYKLADHADKVVVLEWYNQQCPVCQEAEPKMKDLAAKYAKQGVVWLAIDSGANNTPQSNAKWMQEHSLPYPILTDADGKVGHAYGAKTTPHMVVINKGKVAYIGAHDDKKGRSYVSEALDAVLAGKEVPLAKTQAYGCSVKYKK